MADDPLMNDPQAFELLSSDRQEFLLNWIDRNLLPIQSFNPRHTSYGLKQWISEDKEYFTNGEFKGAMLKAGYKVQNRSALNWVFNVSEKSPIIQRKQIR